MKDSKLRRVMAEHGYEMTPADVQQDKESIVRKIAPELLDEQGLTVDEALDELVEELRQYPGLGNL